MRSTKTHSEKIFQPIEDTSLLDALNALSRSVNIISTYGNHHPAFKQAISAAVVSMQTLFLERKKVNIGAFNGVMTIDEVPVNAVGILLKSIERRLVQLHITGLRIARGISESELTKLAELLANNGSEDFNEEMSQSNLAHITTESTRFQAVREDQTVANKGDLAGAKGNGILVLEDDQADPETGTNSEAPVHVEQIVAFLKGDIDIDDGNVGEELSELASDPDRLGQMIMESVAIRQSASGLSGGESLNDIVLGCLRRTYDGLHKQPSLQTTEGVADLKKSMLLLEETMLDKMRNLAGEANPELDRQIVQTIREMEENLEFEIAANQYMEHRDAIEASKQQLKEYVRTKGTDVAEDLISSTGFPSADWHRIVVDSQNAGSQDSQPPIVDGLNTLATVFEKLESLMNSNFPDGNKVEHLLGQANDNLGDATCSTKEKIDSLSMQLHAIKEDTGTIDGNAQEMDRKELLSSIAEIAQELMQPLTVINASLEMLLGGYAGEVAPDQNNLLSLASRSGDDLNYLMQELIKIVGIPTNRGVDKRFAIPHAS